jgi:hypothetical protein
MKKQMLTIAVVMMTLSASVGATLVMAKPQAAPPAKPEAQQARAVTSKPEPRKKGLDRELKPWQFEVGQRGQLYRTHRYYYKIESVLSADRLVVLEDARSDTLAWSRDQSVGGVGARITPVRFIVETPTEGLVDGKRVELPGEWEVADTVQLGGATLFALRRPQ